MQKKSK